METIFFRSEAVCANFINIIDTVVFNIFPAINKSSFGCPGEGFWESFLMFSGDLGLPFVDFEVIKIRGFSVEMSRILGTPRG